MRNSLGQTVEDTMSFAFDISSPMPYELSFDTAVSRWLVKELQEKHGIACEFEDDGQPKPPDDDIRVLLLPNVGELLSNVFKHINAKKEKASVRRIGSQIKVNVEDDGVGFNPAKVVARGISEGAFGLSVFASVSSDW